MFYRFSLLFKLYILFKFILYGVKCDKIVINETLEKLIKITLTNWKLGLFQQTCDHTICATKEMKKLLKIA